MVEFALIGPLFFLFVVLIVQGALYINAQATIDNMTREIARASAVCGTTMGGWKYQSQATVPSCQDAALAQQRYNFLPNLSSAHVYQCAGSSVPASGRCATDQAWQQPTSPGQQVEVDVVYTYTFYVDPLLGKEGPSVPITSSARMLAQQ